MKNATTKTILTLMSAVILAEEAEAALSTSEKVIIGLSSAGIAAGVATMVGSGVMAYQISKKAKEALAKLEDEQKAAAAAESRAKAVEAENRIREKKQNLGDLMGRNEKWIDEVSGRMVVPGTVPDGQSRVALEHLLDAATDVGRAKNNFLQTEWGQDVEKAKVLFVRMYSALLHLTAVEGVWESKLLTESVRSMIEEIKKFCSENGIPRGGNLSDLMRDAGNAARLTQDAGNAVFGDVGFR
ncbi:MAG: hypothetical protein LBO73_04245 [Holosporaceae bacterium]|jgi:hypothetical protein|nr:hypothetical protein [Holosporaceae bacterium]